MTNKQARTSNKRDPEEKLEEIRTEIARVRTREEKRLIAAAEKAGYFRHRFDAAQARSMFKTAIDALEPRKPSTLAKLESDAAHLRSRMARATRADDARRKALLGGFLVAQCRHKPELHAAIAPDLRAFLANHHNPQVATRNLALLEGFLADPASGGVGTTDAENSEAAQTDHRDRAHRLILLGAWVLEQHETRADIALLVATELEGFLDQEKHADRHKELLGDILA